MKFLDDKGDGVKTKSSWFSHRLGADINVVRWGTFGQPVLIFPTAGGDCEEIERFLMLQVLDDLIAAGRIKVYSCDSAGGQALVDSDSSDAYRAHMTNMFQEFIYHELVPAIRLDCDSPDIEVIAAGASIGAFNSLAVACRYPDVFRAAICMSGTYKMERFYERQPPQEFYASSPLHFVPHLRGEQLEKLRTRFILLPSGEGRAEAIGESFLVAHTLGSMGVPNRVASWGAEWHHDWPTWREMLPQYLDELTKVDPSP